MIGNDWDIVLSEEYEKEYFLKIKNVVRNEYNNKVIFPPADRVFYAFRETSYKDTKVVILGQDPYHTPGAAHGLAFSVPDNQPIPPSLVNIYKEIDNDIGRQVNQTGNLSRWQEQGVLLLNNTS